MSSGWIGAKCIVQPWPTLPTCLSRPSPPLLACCPLSSSRTPASSIVLRNTSSYRIPSDETNWTILKNLRSDFRFNLILSSSAFFFQLHCIASSLTFLTILPLNAHTDQFVNSFHRCESGRRKKENNQSAIGRFLTQTHHKEKRNSLMDFHHICDCFLHHCTLGPGNCKILQKHNCLVINSAHIHLLFFC